MKNRTDLIHVGHGPVSASLACGACYAPGYSDTGERRPRTMVAAYSDLPAKARALMAKRAARP